MDSKPGEGKTDGGTDVLLSAFYADLPGEEGEYGAGSNSSHAAFQLKYWRCLYCSQLSFRVHHPDARLVLATNVERLPTVDGLDLGKALQDLGTTLVRPEFTFAPPLAFGRRWRATFYKLDALAAAAETYGEDAFVLLLDTDIVAVRPLHPVRRRLDQAKVLAYRTPYDEVEDINGLNRPQIGEVRAAMGYPVPRAPKAYGGEFLGMRVRDLRPFVADLRAAWSETLSRWQAGESHFRTEEHLFSHLLARDGSSVDDGEGLIRRIWTTTKLYDAVESDLALPLWHLPGEKGYGFDALFRRTAGASDPSSHFDVQRLASTFQIPRRSPPQRVVRLARTAFEHLHRRKRS